MPTSSSIITTIDDISVPFERLYDYTKGSADPSGAQTTESFKVAYSDIFPFIRQVAGGTPRAVGSLLVFPSPLQMPENPYFFAQGLDWESDGVDTTAGSTVGNPCYGFARVRVHFATLPYPSDKFFAVEQRGTAQEVTIPGAPYSFNTSGKKIDQDYGVKLGSTELSITWYNLAEVNWAAASPLLGTVNSEVFDPYGDGSFLSDVGTLLFNTIESSYQHDFAGNVKYQARYSFLFRSQPWNYALDGSTGNWDLVVPQPYSSADHNSLFLA